MLQVKIEIVYKGVILQRIPIMKEIIFVKVSITFTDISVN